MPSPTPQRPPEVELFFVAVPGFEHTLTREAKAKRFRDAKAIKGGVTAKGRWSEAWRANLVLRGASRVLARIGSFRAGALYELDKRARTVKWASVLRPDVAVRVEATCRGSKIYHSGAAAERVARAIHDAIGVPVADDAPVTIKVRLERDVCTLAVDTSGDLLHKRGHKQAVAKAPMRETLAALFLSEMAYDGRVPVLDPMCGSGTFVIEAAEIAADLAPGRDRAFAFEHLATFDAEAWAAMRDALSPIEPPVRFYGSDRDAGAIEASTANAGRAGVAPWCTFEQRVISDIRAPGVAAGLVMVNPPYGTRIGELRRLGPLYQTLGRGLRERFSGWRVGLVTNDPTLAAATGLPFGTPFGPVSHGGIRVWLFRTEPLA